MLELEDVASPVVVGASVVAAGSFVVVDKYELFRYQPAVVQAAYYTVVLYITVARLSYFVAYYWTIMNDSYY